MSATTIEIFSGLDDLSYRASEIIKGCLTNAPGKKEYFTLALCGGATPKKLYSLMATHRTLQSQIPWEQIHIFWGDDRHVPPDHPESNYHMANSTLLRKVPILPQNIHRVRTEEPDVEKVAEKYELELQSFFQFDFSQVPIFDCVLLGIGPDGHTASLFPRTKALYEHNRLVVANWVEKLKTHRITMTAPVLNNADTIIVLVSGLEKAEILQQILEGCHQPDLLPAQLIRPTHGRLIWLVDRAAASRLT